MLLYHICQIWNYKVRQYNKILKEESATLRNQCQPCTVCARSGPWAAEYYVQVLFFFWQYELTIGVPSQFAVAFDSRESSTIYFTMLKKSLWYRLGRCVREWRQLVNIACLKTGSESSDCFKAAKFLVRQGDYGVI